MKLNYNDTDGLVYEPTDPTEDVLGEVYTERERQDQCFGEQNWPSGTGDLSYKDAADTWRRLNDEQAKVEKLTFAGILMEEVFEALSESDSARLREELIQVAAVAVCWVEKLDRESKK